MRYPCTFVPAKLSRGPELLYVSCTSVIMHRVFRVKDPVFRVKDPQPIHSQLNSQSMSSITFSKRGLPAGEDLIECGIPIEKHIL